MTWARPTHLPLAVGVMVVFGMVGLTACGSNTSTTSAGGGSPGTTAPPVGALPGTSWNLVSYLSPAGTPATTAVSAAPNATATLSFGDGGQLNGTTGCNSFGGTYVVDGQQLTVTLGPMTQMACGPPIQGQETALLELLPRVTGYTATADRLALSGADGSVLLRYAAGLSGLEGTSWKVTGVNNGTGGVVSTTLTESLTATFGSAGAFTGFGGCNSLTGSYQTTGTDGLTITGLAGTLRACSSDVDALEAEYTAALGKVSTYAISGDTLTLRGRDGATQVTLHTP